MDHSEKNNAIVFAILITTKNRFDELKKTLTLSSNLLNRSDVECIICDDGSDDKEYAYINDNFPQVKLVRNEKSKGLIYSRNMLLSMTVAQYAISLDDDSNFLDSDPLKEIQTYFESNPKCAVQAFRIYWDKVKPFRISSDESSERVSGFVGCGHVWRMSAWSKIPDYPEWFVFYGEEDFAAYQLFKIKLEVHYNPSILIHHRVDVKSRKADKDYRQRLRRSLRAGWYLYFLFLPLSYVPRKIGYSLVAQIKNKVFKGDFKALIAVIQANYDLIINMSRIIKGKNRLTKKEYLKFCELSNTKIYWKPKRKEK